MEKSFTQRIIFDVESTNLELKSRLFKQKQTPCVEKKIKSDDSESVYGSKTQIWSKRKTWNLWRQEGHRLYFVPKISEQQQINWDQNPGY